MTKLETLYASIKGLQDLGLPLNEETLRAADELEEQLIKDEILPALSQNIEPLLNEIQRDLVLVVEHHPGQPLSVALSRKAKISDFTDAKRLEIDPEVEHRDLGPRKKQVTRSAPATGLCVHRKDGTILQQKDAATTFTTAIYEAGLIPVRELNLRFCGINIVSTTKDKKYGNAQREVSPGLYVLTHSSTKDKKKLLDRINDALQMGWTVEIVK